VNRDTPDAAQVAALMDELTRRARDIRATPKSILLPMVMDPARRAGIEATAAEFRRLGTMYAKAAREVDLTAACLNKALRCTRRSIRA
jgi:predicted deacylase